MPIMTPVDLPECVVWIESHENISHNMLTEVTGIKQTSFARTNPDGSHIIIAYNRPLSPNEIKAVEEYLDQRAKPS